MRGHRASATVAASEDFWHVHRAPCGACATPLVQASPGVGSVNFWSNTKHRWLLDKGVCGYSCSAIQTPLLRGALRNTPSREAVELCLCEAKDRRGNGQQPPLIHRPRAPPPGAH